ncbi:MAG: MBOAT family protein [Chitinivibrionales bacterium]|nr:MBOAT family protein [Chitinivibrionales bacterium]MBD3356582.1 MBOAT family protein [Chitinivibrionales bacterium]
MVFSSHFFLFYFLPITLMLYYGLVATRVSLSWLNLLITIASYVFYGWFEPWFVVLMWVSTIVDYACGRAISKPETLEDLKTAASPAALKEEFGRVNIFYPFFVVFSAIFGALGLQGESRKKAMRNSALAISMAVNLGLLGFFKYYMFTMENVNHLVELLGGGENMFRIMYITLPIGISFYTFQTMSYTIDVWRGDAPPVKDMRTFSCFVALFPQLIAGPIIRYNTVAEQLSYRKHSLSMFTSGVAIFIMGLAKKILLADRAAPVADAVFAADGPGVMTAWWGALAYSFQIYFDFCAYSDMAVGLGRMMGFEFIKNFDGPYRADSISNFWNRWHISLSTWIRDYLYISMGGNRVSKSRMYFNLAMAMFLCGVWHGAQWTFIVWGVFHGVLLIWERTMGRQAIYRGLPLLPRIVITNMIVLLGWVVFRAPTLDQTFRYWGAMIGMVGPSASAPLLRAEVFSLQHVVEILICAFFAYQPVQAFEWVKKLTPVKIAVLMALFFVTIVMMFTQAFSPFLYFQF